MTPELHAKIQQIFEAAVDLPPAQRSAYLEEVCRGDSELRERLDRLLEFADDGESPEPSTERFVKECPCCARCYGDSRLTCEHDGTELEPSYPGQLLIAGKYLVERRLGKGGMGAVYLARHTALDKRFALKVILTEGAISKQARDDFETEARALGLLNHPNIVDVTDYGVEQNGGLPYLVMEYLEGQTLAQLLRARGELDIPDALPILRAAANAIDCAHQQNIVHGDLKPSNLFLAGSRNSSAIVKIVDFGLARLTASGAQEDHDSSASSHIRGTPAYMAPELFRGQDATPSSDRFAFGVLAYQVLTGRLPFGDYLQEVVGNIRQAPPAPSTVKAGLPRELDEPLLALLKLDPGERPRSTAEAVRSMETAWLEAARREWRTRETPRRSVMATIAATLAVLLAGFATRLPVFQVWEDRIADARFAILPKHDPDPRLLVVTLDEATLAADSRPLADPAWADKLAGTLQRIFGAGASAVAIDILMPQNWSRSGQFAQAVEQHSGRLVLALFSSPSGSVIGAECLAPLTANLLGPERRKNLFGFVNLAVDPDGAIRRARLAYLDRSGESRPSFAARAAAVAAFQPAHPFPSAAPFWIDYSARPNDLPTVSWKDLDRKLTDQSQLLRGKLVILGADFAGSGDEHRAPSMVSSALVPGVLIEALIVSTITGGLSVRTVSLPAGLLMAGLAGYATILAALLFPHQSGVVLWSAVCVLCAYVTFSFAIFRFSHIMLTLLGPALAMLLSILTGWGLKSFLRPYPTRENLGIPGG
jgi:CHASE2 domain-containing sensor protein/tRNA A-37 threonylcarbamoyl transferase component Bud32